MATTTITSKINIIGNRHTGKSSLMNYILGKENNNENLKNSEVRFETKTLIMGDYKLILYLWDLKGLLSSSTDRTEFYEGSFGGLILFDLTNKDSFNSVLNWSEELLQKSLKDPAVPYIVLGNKADLIDDRQIKEKKAIQFTKSLNKKLKKKGLNTSMGNAYYETSTVTGQNINKAFEHLGRLIIQYWEVGLESMIF